MSVLRLSKVLEFFAWTHCMSHQMKKGTQLSSRILRYRQSKSDTPQKYGYTEGQKNRHNSAITNEFSKRFAAKQTGIIAAWCCEELIFTKTKNKKKNTQDSLSHLTAHIPGAVANRLRRRTSDQTVLGSNLAVAAALSPWTRLFTPIVPRRSLHISFY